jgi:hypothetical protein
MATTTDDVRSAFDSFTTAEFETSDLADGIRVSVHESEAGDFFRTLRVLEFDAESKRIGETLVAHIEAEKSNSLAELFG